jgi:hypothetical protein
VHGINEVVAYDEVAKRAARLSAPTADEWDVVVIGFARKWRSGGSRCGDKLHFVNQRSAPRFVDACAELALHGLQLLLPRLGIGRQFEAARLQSHRARVRCEGRAHDRGPRARDPWQHRPGAVEPPQHIAEKVARFFHESCEFYHGARWKEAQPLLRKKVFLIATSRTV